MIWALEYPKWKDKAGLLFYGALSLTTGGIALACNGGPQIVTGTAIAVASLETARGGARWLLGQTQKSRTINEELNGGQKVNYLASKIFVATYGHIAESLFNKIPIVDHWVEKRPFVTGSLIKLASRSFYLYAMAQANSAIGFAIGCSWVVGDIALACLDKKTQRIWNARHCKTGVANPKP